MTREDGQKILDSVLQMALYMLMGNELMEVIFKMVERARCDVEFRTSSGSCPVESLHAADKALHYLGQRQDRQAREFLQSYTWRTQLGDTVFKKPDVIRRAPDDWGQIAEAYSFGWHKEADNRAAVAKIMAASVRSV